MPSLKKFAKRKGWPLRPKSYLWAMPWLYDLGVRTYYRGIQLAAWIGHPKARAMVRGHRHWYKKLLRGLEAGPRPVVWVHVASLGEYEQVRPLIEGWRKEPSPPRILLSFFSPSGYQVVAPKPEAADYVMYLPLDTPHHAQLLISAAKPSLAVFVRYDLWYHYLHQLKRHQVPTVLISALFRPQDRYFQPTGRVFRQMLTFFDHIFVQDVVSHDLLKGLGLPEVSIAGDTRFDRVWQTAQTTAPIALVETFVEHDFRLMGIGGSLWKEDWAVLRPWLVENKEMCKWIIAPHDISEGMLQHFEAERSLRIVRYSRYQPGQAADVLLIDNIGLLSRLYQYGKMAMVGGAWKQGLHNILEPAAWGVPVVMGPQIRKFPEARQLIELGGGYSVSSGVELAAILDAWVQNPAQAQTAGQMARNMIAQGRGATPQILEWTRQQYQQHYQKQIIRPLTEADFQNVNVSDLGF